MAVGDNFHQFILFFLTLAPCLRSSVSDQDLPRGHGQQLGKHRESEGHVDVIDSSELPSPQQFWNQYASIRKPVVFCGAAKHFPAFQLWTDEYLTENYGNLEVKLEAKREKEEVPVGALGLGRGNQSELFSKRIKRRIPTRYHSCLIRYHGKSEFCHFSCAVHSASEF